MRRPSLGFVPIALVFFSGPALAEVLAEGKPSGGYYWQRVSSKKGERYLCRSTSEANSGPAAVNLGVMSGGGGAGGGRYYCKNLSKQEAQRLLSQGHAYLDKDGDGEAWERSR